MIDPNDAAWVFVEAHAQKTIEEAVSCLKSKSTAFEEVQYQRGRIDAMEGILRLSQPKVVIGSFPDY